MSDSSSASSVVPDSDESVPDHMPTRDLATLLKVSSTLASSLDLASVLQNAVESAVDVLGLETGAIYSLADGMLYLGATTPPLDPGFPVEFRQARLCDHPHIEACVTAGRPVFVGDTRNEDLSPAERIIVETRQMRSLLYVPLIAQDAVIGSIIVGSQTRRHKLTPRQVDMCRTLGYQIALTVANAELYDSILKAKTDLELAYDATIAGWSHALEMRDIATQGHTVRVTKITLQLARALGIPDSEIPHLHRGSLLHDIGKMVVPDSILNRPGPLTQEEWVIMRAHPVHAHDFLRHIPFLAPALDIPYCHHERWDGSGYPRGLAHTDIPLSVRAFAVVDVFDALTSDRPYRAAWTSRHARDHIRLQSGHHFDPQVVEAFFATVDCAR